MATPAFAFLCSNKQKKISPDHANDLDGLEEVADEVFQEGMAQNEDAFGLGFDEEAVDYYAQEQLPEGPLTNPNFESSFIEHEDSIFCLDVNKSETLVISGDGNDLAFIWNVEENKVITILKGHTDSVIWVGFSCNEEYCATASMDCTIRVYNTEDFSLKHILEGPSEEIEFSCWHPRGNVILAGSKDCTIWMWDAKKGRCLQVFAGHGGAVTTGGFLYDGKTAFTGCEDGSVKLWNPKDGSMKESFGVTKKSHFHQTTVTNTDFHPNKKIFASASQDASIFLIHGKKGKILSHFRGHSNPIEALAFAPHHYLASGDLSGLLIIWDIRTNTKRNKIKFSSGVLCILFHSDSSLFAGFVDGSVIRMAPKSGNLECIYRGHMGPIHGMLFLKDKNRLVTCSDDGTCLIWDASLNDLEKEQYEEKEEEGEEIEIEEEEEEEEMEIQEEEEGDKVEQKKVNENTEKEVEEIITQISQTQI